SVERIRARRAPDRGVTRQIVLAQIRFGFDDAAACHTLGRCALEHRAEKISGNQLGLAIKEVARENPSATRTPRGERGVSCHHHSGTPLVVAFFALPLPRGAAFAGSFAPRFAGDRRCEAVTLDVSADWPARGAAAWTAGVPLAGVAAL